MSDETTEKKLRRASVNLETGTVEVYGERDGSGKQAVVAVVSLKIDELPPEMLRKAAAQGIYDIAGNGFYRKDGITPAEVQSIVERTVASFIAGTWTPGRTFTSEPDDIVVALAEVTGVPVHVMEHDIETRLVRDEHGEPVKDRRGRNKRVFTQAALDALADDPAVKPIMAKLARERADKLAREAKAHKGGTTSVHDKFAHLLAPKAEAEAAQ